VEHLRKEMTERGVGKACLAANELCWMTVRHLCRFEVTPYSRAVCQCRITRRNTHTHNLVYLSLAQDRTPHESLPMPVGTRRQYFRLVAGPVSVWFSEHSTVNPDSRYQPEVDVGLCLCLCLGLCQRCDLYAHSCMHLGEKKVIY